MTRSRNKGVLIVALVLVLAAIGLVIAVTAYAFKKSDEIGSGGGGSVTPGTVTTLPLSTQTIPQSSLSMTSWDFDRNAFQMMGYNYRSTSGSRGIRFFVNIPYSLKEAAEQNSGTYRFGAIMMPVHYFAEIEALYEAGEAIDWYDAVLEQGKNFLFNSYSINNLNECVVDGEEVYYMNFSLANIKAGNTMLPFSCIFFVERYTSSASDEFVREYATFPEGKDYASFGVTYAHVCGEALNDYTSNLVSFSDETVEDLLKTMDYAIDIVNGEDPSNDEISSVELKVPSVAVSLNLGENARISYEVVPSEELLDIPVRWLSSNENVVKVDPDGTIYSVGYGEANVSVHVGGQKHTYYFLVTGPKEEVLAFLRKDYDANFALMTGTAPDGSTVQLTYQDLAAYAEYFEEEIWNEEEYSWNLLWVVQAARHLGVKDVAGQELESIDLSVLCYGARAALADFTAEEDSEHPYEMELYGHTFYSAFSGMERIELKKVAEYDGW